MSNEALKSCECGHKVTVDSKKHSEEFGVRVHFYCVNCMTFTEIIAECKREAIAAWNKMVKEASND